MRIPFNRPFIIGKELEYIREAVESEHLSGNGPFTRRCQEWIETNHHAGKALLTHSGTAALEMAALLLEISPGDEVIMPSFTFVSTANAFVLRGGVPVFVDIDPETLNIDSAAVRNAITEKTKAVAAVHYAGVPCSMGALLELSRTHAIPLVEDAAQALLSTWNGQPAGSFGSLAALSFHETKNCISGEGGALLINDPSLFERAQILWEKGTNRTQFFEGRVDKYTWVDIGSSFLPSELSAAFLWAQLQDAERIARHRLELWSRYQERLLGVEAEGKCRLPAIPEGHRGNGHIFYLLVNTAGERQALLHFLKESGIEAVFHYIPLHSSPAGLKYGRVHGSLRHTDTLSGRLVRLPMHYGMTVDDVDRVTEILVQFWHQGRN